MHFKIILALFLKLCPGAPTIEEDGAAFSFTLGGNWWISQTLGQAGAYLTEQVVHCKPLYNNNMLSYVNTFKDKLCTLTIQIILVSNGGGR